MVEELHEWASKELSDFTAREDPVVHGHEGKQEDEPDADEELGEAVALPPSRKSLVPDGGEELLTVRVSYKLEIQVRLTEIR